MKKSVIEQSIDIQAPVADVWRVFTDPALTRKMGGEYVSDWQIGGPFNFRGLDGTTHTHGAIVQIEPQTILKHKLFVPGAIGDNPLVISTVTYEFQRRQGYTTLAAREELTEPIDEEAYAAAVEGWQAALAAVKHIAEA